MINTGRRIGCGVLPGRCYSGGVFFLVMYIRLLRSTGNFREKVPDSEAILSPFFVALPIDSSPAGSILHNSETGVLLSVSYIDTYVDWQDGDEDTSGELATKTQRVLSRREGWW